MNPVSAPSRAARASALALAALLSACSILGSEKTTFTVYAPNPRVAADPTWPVVRSQLAITTPDTAREADGLRIVVRPTPLEWQVYKGASWAKRPTDMVTDVVLRTLEDSGRIPAVARQGTGIAADYKLVLDLRRFESDYAGAAVPNATIEVSAKLLHANDQSVIASRVFRHAEPAASAAVADVAAAFERALGGIGHGISGWVLVTAAAHDRDGHLPTR
ncbi:MAG TPA: ABC-type transport auxiliary lipoprotein family protein [Lysobacter sp.]|nr:ABC-type transport auxiliary lipoprotein family protein [Lysobacter sp.]